MIYNLRERSISKTDDLSSDEGIMVWKNRHRFFIRCVSIALTLLFLDQQAGWSQNGRPVWAEAKNFKTLYQDPIPEKSFDIPYDIANTQEVTLNGGNETIVHIQDAHASLSAQYSIANLLDSLVTNYDLEFIAVEGAEGYIDTSILKSCPDKEIRKKAADFLMQEGKMSAGEFFTITNDNDNICLYGIEEDELYSKNLKSFQHVAEMRAEQTGNLKNLLQQLYLLGEKIYSKDLNVLNKNSIKHRDGLLSFSDYWEIQESFIEKYRISVSGYIEISKLLESIKLEKIIDFPKANADRRRLIDEISSNMAKPELEKLVLKSLAFKQNKISQGTFHNYLLELAETRNVSSEGYENLINFTKYITLYESVELTRLYHEIEEVEEIIRQKLYRNNEEKDLYKMTRLAKLLKQLYSMELNNGEFRFLQKNYMDFSPKEYARFIKEKCEKHGVVITGEYELSEIGENIDGAMKFYVDAETRNSAMFRNTLKKMRKNGKKVAALITGGYHTEGLTELMQKDNLSYLVIEPKFQEGKERPYIAILTNKKRPYEKILETGRYTLAAQLFFYNHNLSEIKPVLFGIFGDVVLKGGDLKVFMKNWLEKRKSFCQEYVIPNQSEIKGPCVTNEELEEFFNAVNGEKIGTRAVIAEKDEDKSGQQKMNFVTLCGQDYTFHFNPTSEKDREIFKNRISGGEERGKDFLGAIQDLKAKTTEKEDIAKLAELELNLKTSIDLFNRDDEFDEKAVEALKTNKQVRVREVVNVLKGKKLEEKESDIREILRS
ncbi:MAG: hypothetical protein KJ864_02625, partial [Candidatus Omnitrophica bacterium]|nr:hypothetical protein [Candidatus Omnitrophota bacterium]